MAVYAAKIHRAEGTDDPEGIRSWTKDDGERPESYVGESNRTVATALVRNYAGLWLFADGFIFVVPFADGMTLKSASLDVVALAAVVLVGYQLFSYCSRPYDPWICLSDDCR
ncbi:hypothetical protein SAMN05216285_3481 [Natrinema salifodinae]|uniref:Uncharacterized protein n=1 Tax=Natrinema salifodinae TaxID=1202768 RepID=A0A1I0QFC8_9EURY|nr:hypothetical protein SAMN05216285_3481 [Natrinema salifodinae]